MKIVELKRSGIGLIAEFRGIPNGFPNLGKTHPHHGGCRCPMAAMVPRPRHRRTQQSANMMLDMSMSLKLEDIIVFTIY